MRAFDHLNREVLKIQVFAAVNRDELGFVHTNRERDVRRGSRADYFGAELFRDERDVGDEYHLDPAKGRTHDRDSAFFYIGNHLHLTGYVNLIGSLG
jgi:hypothetical protein